jgi:pimeloyl-ACP methyl ester carboxylesterase
MKRLTHISIFAIFILSLSSCLKLDSFLYSNSAEETYLLDKYTGEVDFRLDTVSPAYFIPDSLIHIFTLQSKTAEETSSTKIYALYVGDTSRIKTDTVIMYCHGNYDHIDFYWPRTKLLANVGGNLHYGVMTIDYRGFGCSEGVPTEAGMYADVNAALQWLKDKGLESTRLIMYGFSLGTAPACELTANPTILTPSKLILEDPFASAEVMVQDASKLSMPGSAYVSLKIDNAEEIKKVTQPFLWFHGVDDHFLSMKTHGAVVFKNYGGDAANKDSVLVPGAGHSTVPQTYGFANYTKKIADFIQK